MTSGGSGSDCENCGEKGQTFPITAKIVRRIRFLKIPFSSYRASGMLCHECGYFEEGEIDGDS